MFPDEVGGYPLPNCLKSEDDWHRLCQMDAPRFTDEDLRVEQLRVQLAYVAAYGQRIYVRTTGIESYVRADVWLRQRTEALELETYRRRGRRSA
jgi:hypothetical protein